MKKRIKKKIHKYIKQYISKNNMVRLCDVNNPIVAVHNPSLKISSNINISTSDFEQQYNNKEYRDSFLKFYKEKILYNFTKNEDFINSVIYEIDRNPVDGNYVITGIIEIYNPNMN